ncbi:Protein NRT1/ PTR FAMILY 4.3 [Vigna angularis]|uniref:Protein NRT1/ PTR FAMILY 4.3 n=1 Tax=Phaseolus angularis TaxID=3914 RepID=A0A8T0KGA7_PHAAN|nr:Protein NRT1/ PTR FAMILY 4.3 [Vigna angularis]
MGLFANSDPNMFVVPVPVAQVHDWVQQNIVAALEYISEWTSSKKNGSASPSDHDVAMTDASSASVNKASTSTRGLQAFEIMAITAVGNNLITYVTNDMHFPLSKAANVVTNFVGTIFLLALLEGYLSDSHLGSFWTMLIFGFLELSVSHSLPSPTPTLSSPFFSDSHVPQLKPASFNLLTDGEHCVEAKGFKAAIFFVALYLVALGSGCVKPNMVAHGGDQFDQDNPKQLKKLSTYFNAAYFVFSLGELVSLTILVWVQTHSGMDVGFGVSVVVMEIGLISLICGTLYYRQYFTLPNVF